MRGTKIIILKLWVLLATGSSCEFSQDENFTNVQCSAYNELKIGQKMAEIDFRKYSLYQDVNLGKRAYRSRIEQPFMFILAEEKIAVVSMTVVILDDKERLDKLICSYSLGQSLATIEDRKRFLNMVQSNGIDCFSVDSLIKKRVLTNTYPAHSEIFKFSNESNVAFYYIVE